jgi:hypothetical protein
MMMNKLSALFFRVDKTKTPFFSQKLFNDDMSNAFVRALAHPRQLNHWGVDTLLDALGGLMKDNPSVLCNQFRERMSASTLPQNKMLYYFFRKNFHQSDEGKKLIEWVQGHSEQLGKLADELSRSELAAEKITGPALQDMRGAIREMGIEALAL